MNLYPLIDLIEYITKFQLELLSKEWVDFTWSNEFPVPLELPSEYELQVDVDFVDLLRDVRTFIERWLDEEMDLDCPGPSRGSLTAKKSWNQLVHQINHKSLLCLLSAFISQYNQASQSEECEDVNTRAIEAARLYFTLICIDGSHIFQVFQSAIYFQCLEILKSFALLNSTIKAPKRTGRRRNTANDDDDDYDMENGCDLNPADMRELIKSNCSLLDELDNCLRKFSLGMDQSALNQTVQTMIQLVCVERKDSSFLDHRPTRNTTTYIAFKAYSVLGNLCTEFHGPVSETLKDVMRSLLPCLTIYENRTFQQVSQDAIVIKDHSINFIINIVKSLREQSYDTVYTVVQQLCVRIPDRADIRSKCVDIIIDMVNRFPYNLYYRSLLFLCSLCCSDTVKHRLVGVELLSKILNNPPRDPLDETLSTQGRNSNNQRYSARSSTLSVPESNFKCVISHKFLFSLIVSRCKDVSPRIRIKSLSILSNLLKSREVFVGDIVEEIFVYHVDFEEKELFDFNHFIRNKLYNSEESPNPLPTAGSLIKLIERLTHDPKALVRKNALHVTSDICLIHERWITEERLNILISACKDLSVGNRKLMAQCLTDMLLMYPNSELLINSWVEGVVPLFAENEIKSQEKVLELAANVILDNIVPLQKLSSSKDRLPWRVIATISKLDMRKLFRFACKQWCLKNAIKDHYIKHLLTYIGSENNFAAWYFLVCLSEFMDLPNPETVLNYFYEKIFKNHSINELESQLVMQALVLNWRKLKKDQIQDLCTNLKEALENYEIPLPLISGGMDIIHLNNPEMTKKWTKQVLMDCQKRIKQRVMTIMKVEYYSDTLLCRYIFTLGEASQISPDIVDKETITALCNLVDFANIDPEPGQLEKSLSNFGYVHAVTVCTLGRLSLQNQFTAKAVVPILGALVSAKSPSAIKNNANIALTDLCIRFSSLVEPFFGDMFVCLKDPDPVVRKNTLLLLAMLIQEQFLKLKSHVFIYLLSMLRDPSNEIRDFTSSFIVNSLMAKDPNIAFTHFTQSIFFLNSYEGVMEQISPQEKSMFCLPGEECSGARRELYIFLLQTMNDVLKFKTKYRICIEILNAIAEGTIPLETMGVSMLKDSLYIIGCDEIKMTARKVGKEGGAEDEDEEVAEPVAVAKKSIMNQIFSSLSKQNLVENVIPIIKSLRNKLQSVKSPLVVDCMICLREILKDFSKEQVQEILAADPDLASEVLHELNRLEERGEVIPNNSQDEPGLSSPQDTIMEQMEQVARRISCRVMLHGPESIAQDSNQGDDDIVGNQNSSPTPMDLNETPRTSQVMPGCSTQRRSVSRQNGSTSKSNSKTSKKSNSINRSDSVRSDRSSSVLSDLQGDTSGNCSPSSSASLSSQVSSLSSQSSSSGSSSSGSSGSSFSRSRQRRKR